MSRKQDLERLELQMAKVSPMQERYKKIQEELLHDRQAKLYQALKSYISDAQLDVCKKEQIVEIVKTHLNGGYHELDSITEAEKARRARFEEQLAEAAKRGAGKSRRQASAAPVEEPEAVTVAESEVIHESNGVNEEVE